MNIGLNSRTTFQTLAIAFSSATKGSPRSSTLLFSCILDVTSAFLHWKVLSGSQPRIVCITLQKLSALYGKALPSPRLSLAVWGLERLEKLMRLLLRSYIEACRKIEGRGRASKICTSDESCVGVLRKFTKVASQNH